MIAVLQQHCRLRLHNQDVFASTVGGARLSEPATDLAIAISLASASYSRPAPQGIVAIGEIGLAGELRRVRDLPQRLAEAARLGFQYAVVPAERSGPHRRRADGQRAAGDRRARHRLRAGPARLRRADPDGAGPQCPLTPREPNDPLD